MFEIEVKVRRQETIHTREVAYLFECPLCDESTYPWNLLQEYVETKALEHLTGHHRAMARRIHVRLKEQK